MAGAINKDGTPRKAGSGRRKGSVSLVSVPLSELNSVLQPHDLVVVGRVFLSKTALGTKYLPKIDAPTPQGGVTLTTNA